MLIHAGGAGRKPVAAGKHRNRVSASAGNVNPSAENGINRNANHHLLSETDGAVMQTATANNSKMVIAGSNPAQCASGRMRIKAVW